MTQRSVIFFILLAALVLAPAAPLHAQTTPPAREITNIRGDLYRVREDTHHSVFLVTADGIVLGDPINVGAATWLKAELAQRFSNQPVRYVLFSHRHFDHASGGRVFADTAELVGHANFNRELAESKAGRDEQFLRADQDKNGRIDGPELAGFVGSIIAKQDKNHDGVVTLEELFADVVPVQSTYTNRRTITLGGKRVELMHPGEAHSPDMTVLFFPAERVVFVVDFIPVRSFPLFITSTPEEIISSVRAVEALDFDLLVPGHGDVATKADIVAFRQYIQELAAGVRQGLKAGRTLEQTQASLTMERYKMWPGYPMEKNQNIAQLYALLGSGK